MTPKAKSEFTIKFWGVRGSVPCPGKKTVRYGGNTPCVEMLVGQQRLIFDGGTGLRLLGEELMAQGSPVQGHLFFSHSHWDHIQGFPFFAPAFQAGNSFNIYGVLMGEDGDGVTIRQRLHDQMLHPNFPVPLQVMQSDLRFFALAVAENLPLGDVTVTNARLNHPGGAVGYRVDWQGLAAAYITDTEHYPDRLDEAVLTLAQGVDVLIIDATYTEQEYHNPQGGKVGWGHSTWQEAVKVAQASQVKQLVLFHHDPSHDDDCLDEICGAARQKFAQTTVAQEGQSIVLQAIREQNQDCSGSVAPLTV
ncbi:MBL fold metallo-hydrolase [Picosynechococcus sp. NKBG15041c]|uniref:MBL fold metallo-hydrolase n=1 Tax=Picosynechococcus sp. NKBG15041c TaxID=1407650 RepID=UPI0004A4E6D3|nr:MBL fold metallo-hydrolase [Picosynechococcus sp. NKBG15041c]